MIPTALQKISQQISKHKIKLSAYSSDGRINSIQSEKKIIEFIKSLKGRKVTSPKSRSWYDIKIENFYCNIKVSNMTSNDNTVGKSVIHYFLTGKPASTVQLTNTVIPALSGNPFLLLSLKNL